MTVNTGTLIVMTWFLCTALKAFADLKIERNADRQEMVRLIFLFVCGIAAVTFAGWAYKGFILDLKGLVLLK